MSESVNKRTATQLSSFEGLTPGTNRINDGLNLLDMIRMKSNQIKSENQFEMNRIKKECDLFLYKSKQGISKLDLLGNQLILQLESNQYMNISPK